MLLRSQYVANVALLRKKDLLLQTCCSSSACQIQSSRKPFDSFDRGCIQSWPCSTQLGFSDFRLHLQLAAVVSLSLPPCKLSGHDRSQCPVLHALLNNGRITRQTHVMCGPSWQLLFVSWAQHARLHLSSGNIPPLSPCRGSATVMTVTAAVYMALLSIWS